MANPMFIPMSISEGMANPCWQKMVLYDMIVLHTSGIWELVQLPPNKTIIGFHRVKEGWIGW